MAAVIGRGCSEIAAETAKFGETARPFFRFLSPKGESAECFRIDAMRGLFFFGKL